MEITYPNKPSPEAIARFSRKIEEFLSAHQLSVSVTLNANPLRISSTINGIPSEELNLWVGKVTIHTPTVNELEVELFNRGIEEDMSDDAIWHDAYQIQDQLYFYLKRTPGNLKDDNDPYWKLWGHIRK